MNHDNLNHLLDLYFQEGTEKKARRIREHTQKCESCQAYLTDLEEVEKTLLKWEDEKPLPQTLNLILDKLPAAPPARLAPWSRLSLMPIFGIAASILLISMLIFFVKGWITHLPVWEVLEQFWFVQAFGSLGVVIMLFFTLGAFVTLSLAPILFFASQKTNFIYRY